MRLVFGVFLPLTLAWLAACALYVVDFGWPAFLALPAGELGDFAAGAFSPIAFLWLLAAVFIQAAQLSEQRQEMRETRVQFEQQTELMRLETAQMLETQRVEKSLRITRGLISDIVRLTDKLVIKGWPTGPIYLLGAPEALRSALREDPPEALRVIQAQARVSITTLRARRDAGDRLEPGQIEHLTGHLKRVATRLQQIANVLRPKWSGDMTVDGAINRIAGEKALETRDYAAYSALEFALLSEVYRAGATESEVHELSRSLQQYFSAQPMTDVAP